MAENSTINNPNISGPSRRRRNKPWANKPTVKDLAKEAGVSTATVSRALNQPDSVSEDLRHRVEAAAKKLDYMPSAAARILSSNKSNTIGAVFPTLNNAIFSGSIEAFENTLAENGYTLLLTVSSYDQKNEEKHIRRLLERGVDGILLVGLNHSKAVWEILEKAACPYVTIWGYRRNTDIPYIGIDNAKAAEQIIDHLVELGHKRIALLAGIVRGNDRAEQRLRGFKRGLKRHGQDADPALILQRPYGHEYGREALDIFLGHANPPTAIVCGNDVLAMGVLFEATARGIAVPGELSITGYDNLPITEHMMPAMTTVSIPSEEMGVHAAEALVKKLKHNEQLTSQCLPAPLIVRGTTGPAALNKKRSGTKKRRNPGS